MSEVEALERIERLLQLLVSLKIGEVRGDRSQKDMILLLADYGCSPTEISKLLGVTTNSVNPVLSRARRASRKR